MEELHKVLQERTDKLKQSYMDYENNPYNPKTAHALRVSSRKLRSLLNFLKPTFDQGEYDRLNGELKALAQVYGQVREIDVLIDLCNDIALRKPDLSRHYRDMFKYLHQQRDKEMRRTFNKTSVRTTESAIGSVEEAVGTLSFEAKGDWNDYIGKRLDKKRKKIAEDYKNVDLEDYEAVHDIRKRAKKLRYAARYFGHLADLKHKKIMKKAKRVQDEFGKKTDATVNRHMLEEFAERVENKDLKKLLKKMSREQEAFKEEQ